MTIDKLFGIVAFISLPRNVAFHTGSCYFKIDLTLYRSCHPGCLTRLGKSGKMVLNQHIIFWRSYVWFALYQSVGSLPRSHLFKVFDHPIRKQSLIRTGAKQPEGLMPNRAQVMRSYLYAWSFGILEELPANPPPGIINCTSDGDPLKHIGSLTTH